jgi:hypothetical protein
VSIWHAVTWDLDGWKQFTEKGQPVRFEAPDLEHARLFAVRRNLPKNVRMVSSAALALDQDAHARQRGEAKRGQRERTRTKSKPAEAEWLTEARQELAAFDTQRLAYTRTTKG